MKKLLAATALDNAISSLSDSLPFNLRQLGYQDVFVQLHGYPDLISKYDFEDEHLARVIFSEFLPTLCVSTSSQYQQCSGYMLRKDFQEKFHLKPFESTLVTVFLDHVEQLLFKLGYKQSVLLKLGEKQVFKIPANPSYIPEQAKPGDKLLFFYLYSFPIHCAVVSSQISQTTGEFLIDSKNKFNNPTITSWYTLIENMQESYPSHLTYALYSESV